MGVGLSGSSEMTQMFEADAVITWVDSDNVAHAEDYYLSDYAQVSKTHTHTHTRTHTHTHTHTVSLSLSSVEVE